MCEQLRILIVTTSYPLKHDSVSGIFLARLVKQLGSEHRITVITPADDKVQPIPVSKNIQVVPFRYAPSKIQKLAHAPGGIPVALKRNPFYYLLLPLLLFGMMLACLKHGRNAHVIHANWAICGLVAGITGRILNVPVITTLRGEDVTRATQNWLDARILQLCVRTNKNIVGVSVAITDWLEQHHGEARHKFKLVENGVDDSFLSISNKRSLSSAVRLIVIGSLIPRKGVDTVINALSLTTNIELSIVGEGQELMTLRKLIEEKGVTNRVSFMGSVVPDSIPALLFEHDILVLASYSEGRPNVILEAMAASIPVVASNIDGVNELVEDDVTGLLFEAGNSAELAICLKKLLKEPQLMKSMGVAGRNAILKRGLVWNKTASRYIDVYQSVITGDI